MNTETLLPLLESLAVMLTQLSQALAMRLKVSVMWSVVLPAIPMPIILTVTKRLMRARNAVFRLAERVRTGRPLTRRSPIRAADAPPRRKAAASAEPPVLLPRAIGWLRDMAGVSAGGFAFLLLRVLSDPEVKALMATTPRLGNALRPLCRMFDIPYSALRAKASTEEAVVDPPTETPPPEPPPPKKKRVRKLSKFQLWASTARFGVPLLDRPPGRTLDEVVKRGPPRGSSFLKPI